MRRSNVKWLNRCTGNFFGYRDIMEGKYLRVIRRVLLNGRIATALREKG
jgi:hypothetical protein